MPSRRKTRESIRSHTGAFAPPPKGLMPHTMLPFRAHAAVTASAASSVLMPTSRPARTMKADGFGVVVSIRLGSGDGFQDATPQAPHSPLDVASSRTAHA